MEISNTIGVDDKQALLKQKVKQYKRIYFLAKLTAWVLLALVALNIMLAAFAKDKLTRPLSDKEELGGQFAADSAGRMLAIPVYNEKDSLLSIAISLDSGNHFKQYGSWKHPDEFSEMDEIKTIAITKDSCIIAASDNYVYLKSVHADSFTCINGLTDTTDYDFIRGFCLVPSTDSVYIYTDANNVFYLSYKNYDSIIAGKFEGDTTDYFMSYFPYITSMTVSAAGKIAVISGTKVLINTNFVHKNIYPVSKFLNVKNDLRSRIADTAQLSVMSDTSVVADTSYLKYKAKKIKTK